MKNNIIKDKSFSFAVKGIKLSKRLAKDQNEYVLSKQILKSSTSIGANIREAQNAESKADFVHKLAIAQKECDESIYWLELLKETDYISKSEFDELSKDANELLKIIRSIIITTKKNNL